MEKVRDIKELELISNSLRQDVIKMLTEAGSGHPGGSLGMSDIFTALYFNIMNYDPKKPRWEKRDYIVLSNGHICPIMYTAMAYAEFFPKKELMTLRKFESRLQGHPEKRRLPGLETTSGPLGSGLSQAAGMALSLKMDKKKNKVFCLMSDGEHDEGNTWEAMMFATKYKLDNLIGIVDRNGIQLSGKTKDIMPLKNLRYRYESFGWRVIEINGNHMGEVLRALKKARINLGKPICIIANTTLGKDVSFMEDDYQWHGKAPSKEEADDALKELQYVRGKIKAGKY